MTESSIIQDARDVLANWREETTAGPWSREEMPETGENRVIREFEFFGAQIEEVAPGGVHREDARLIVGTAGNPELLDAWDGMLAQVELIREVCPAVLVAYAERIAAAIVAADERMSA